MRFKTKRFQDMTPRLFSRSGIAVGCVAEALGWQADCFVQVGVGNHHEEIDIITGVWKLPKESVVAFEANPVIYEGIKDKFPGVLENLAVSDCQGRAKLYSKSRHKDGSSLFPHSNQDEGVVEFEVSVNTLDTLMLDMQFDLSKRLLLWLDCEGSELKILKGACRFIEFVDMINVEMTMRPPGDDWCSSEDVHWWLMEHNFYRMWAHTARIHAGQYDSVYVRPELFNPNFCCCPFTIKEWRRWKETIK